MSWDAFWPLLALTAWIALLFSPVLLELDVAWPAPSGGRSVVVRWLLGPFRLPIPSRFSGSAGGTARPSWQQARATALVVRDLDRLVEEVRNLEGRVDVGTGDPASSAVLSGVAWAAWGAALKLLQSRVRVRPAPRVRIAPRYGQGGVAVRLHCILRTRLVHVIGAAPNLKVLGGRRHGRKHAPHGQRHASHHGKPERDGGRQHHPG